MKTDSNREMVKLLADVEKSAYTMTNAFSPEAKLAFYDSLLATPVNYREVSAVSYYKAITLLELGDELESVSAFEDLLKQTDPSDYPKTEKLMKGLAIAHMRLGERTNCLHNHTAQSCVFPIQGAGVHQDKTGSSKAIEIYEMLLKRDKDDLESRWLLNIAYMTIGGYPKDVPPDFLIKGLDEDSSNAVKPFTDAAINTGLNTNNLAGGSIIDDFNNDNYLDLVTSSWSLKEGMHYCRNNGNGSFTEVSDSSGLSQFTGGLNIMQTDYNNDGLKDIFVLRGAWKGPYGKEPNSLLRNNGDGTFTDVTRESGLLSFHPTQTATWNDFNNDGWLDVFIGNESTSQVDLNPCELYINNKNGTFTETAVQSNVAIGAFVKGVTSGDYDNDGLVDIFVSILGHQKMLLKNEGIKNGVVHFKDVTNQAGLAACRARTFPTCFFDYDNDGWLDILVCSYEFGGSLAQYAAAEALHMDVGNSAKQFLFRNKRDGTFEDVTDKAGLNKVAFSMGMNFGDIDNDGYPDIYMGTGSPLYQSLVPNKLFKNVKGQYFIDATSSARVGNLQKGHGVSFADLDNDGDHDIYIDMGGAYKGDAYQNSFYINPGQNDNRWINLDLEGTKCNRAAIGAKIKVTFTENGIERSVYRDVNSGGSFGSNPLMQHIGIGNAAVIDRIEIKWPVSNSIQVFKNVQPGQTVKIKEGSDLLTRINVNRVDFTTKKSGLISCGPAR
ncbi:MAG: CRTAC1 family protein [Chitinophagaceae bacterium]|nr:CRTAC1 family protein [Chitinophagaceae bacterium]